MGSAAAIASSWNVGRILTRFAMLGGDDDGIFRRHRHREQLSVGREGLKEAPPHESEHNIAQRSVG